MLESENICLATNGDVAIKSQQENLFNNGKKQKATLSRRSLRLTAKKTTEENKKKNELNNVSPCTPASKSVTQDKLLSDELQSFRHQLNSIRNKILSKNSSILTLKNVNTNEIVPLNQAIYLNNEIKKSFEVHFAVEDAIESYMPSELLMEPYALAIFDYLRERELQLLSSCLHVNDLITKMTPMEDSNNVATIHVKKTSSFNCYRSGHSRPVAQDERITIRMRAVLVNWLSEIHEEYDFNIETLFIAVGLVDLYLSKKILDIPKSKLQLIGASCFLIAAKYEEIYPISVRDVANLTEFSTLEIIECERNILQTLKFAVTIPVPITFLRRYSRVMLSTEKEHSYAKYFSELTVTDLKLACVEPSLRAAASLALARLVVQMKKNKAISNAASFSDTFNMSLDDSGVESKSANFNVEQALEEIWTSKMFFHSGYNVDQLRPVIADLASLVDSQTRASSLRAIFKKYGASKYSSISSSVYLKNGNLALIAKSLTLIEKN